jgi:hypothetical protein
MCSKNFQTRLMIFIVIAFLGLGAQAARAEPEPGVGKVTTVHSFDPSQDFEKLWGPAKSSCRDRYRR